jgi:hypothetical protein
MEAARALQNGFRPKSVECPSSPANSRQQDEPGTGQRGRKMTFSRKLTSIATAAAIAVTSLGGLTTAASAHDRDGYRGGDRGYDRGYDRHDGYRGDHGYRGGRDRYYARRKDHTGKYVAIGAAALMLGIIASEASRR